MEPTARLVAAGILATALFGLVEGALLLFLPPWEFAAVSAALTLLAALIVLWPLPPAVLGGALGIATGVLIFGGAWLLPLWAFALVVAALMLAIAVTASKTLPGGAVRPDRESAP